jgi:hypothetical protein
MAIPVFVSEFLWEYDVGDPGVADRLERVLIERVMERGG